MTKLDLPENFDSLSYDDQISTILRISTRQATVFIHSHLSYLEEYLNNKYPKLKNPLYSLKTKLNWFYHNRTDFPICKVCGNPFGINKNTKSIINDYSKWCSSKHALQDEEVKQKREQTNTQKYGTGNVFASEYGKKKLRETQEKLYGGLGSGSPIIKQRIAQTCKIKYNADSPLESKEIQNKIKQGFIERHGVDNPFKLQEIQDKIKQANLEKHGVENISYSNYFKQKIIDNLWEKMINHPDAIPMFTKDQYVDDLTYYDWKCKKCGKVFKSRWDAGHLISKCDCQKLFKDTQIKNDRYLIMFSLYIAMKLFLIQER